MEDRSPCGNDRMPKVPSTFPSVNLPLTVNLINAGCQAKMALFALSISSSQIHNAHPGPRPSVLDWLLCCLTSSIDSELRSHPRTLPGGGVGPLKKILSRQETPNSVGAVKGYCSTADDDVNVDDNVDGDGDVDDDEETEEEKRR